MRRLVAVIDFDLADGVAARARLEDALSAFHEYGVDGEVIFAEWWEGEGESPEVGLRALRDRWRPPTPAD